YTEALFSAIPIPNPDAKRKKIILPGDVPSPANPPSGCRFHTRCPYAQKICSEKEPPLEAMGNGHFAACFFPLKSSSFN
ncbi:MAG: oligopeptide/dipeptide ABC transporter ATP-binding protein, partial [Candidatus Bathyarchaeia archaeon]